MYKIIFAPRAYEDAKRLEKSEPKAFQKALRFIEELKEHPKTGTGHPEPLKGQPEKHRLVYRIFETEVVVEVLAAYGHYKDK